MQRYELMGDEMHADPDGAWVRAADAADAIERLRAALQPFAKVATGIPHNWPGECHLRVDGLPVGSTSREWLAYWGVNDGCTTLPTIAEWRAAEAKGGET